MAIIYLARDLRHGRPVALKVIRSELVTLADRFVSEIRSPRGASPPLAGSRLGRPGTGGAAAALG